MNFTFNEVEYNYYSDTYTLEACYPNNVKCIYVYYTKYLFGFLNPEMGRLKSKFYTKKYLHLGKDTEPPYDYFFSLSKHEINIIGSFKTTLTIDLDLVEELKPDRLIYSLFE